MTVQAPEYLKGFYNQTRALGDKSVSSDATFEIVGHESLYLLTKQFPWPTISPGGEIEIATPWGGGAWQPQQLKVHQQGQVSFMETVNGAIERFMKDVAGAGARFDAFVYEGTPDRYRRKCKIVDCFFQIDNPDRDWENRSQIVLINGTLFFHYFGDSTPGNLF
jgi:hypothetical protein